MFGFNNGYPYTDFHELNLDWLLKQVKANKDSIETMNDIISSWADTADRIIEIYNALISGQIPPEIEAVITSWMEENALDLIGDLVKMVFFGLTNDGYFIAYIPEHWDDITFGTTGLDDFPAGIDYGHLTLSY